MLATILVINIICLLGVAAIKLDKHYPKLLMTKAKKLEFEEMELDKEIALLGDVGNLSEEFTELEDIEDEKVCNHQYYPDKYIPEWYCIICNHRYEGDGKPPINMLSSTVGNLCGTQVNVLDDSGWDKLLIPKSKASFEISSSEYTRLSTADKLSLLPPELVEELSYADTSVEDDLKKMSDIKPKYEAPQPMGRRFG